MLSAGQKVNDLMGFLLHANADREESANRRKILTSAVLKLNSLNSLVFRQAASAIITLKVPVVSGQYLLNSATKKLNSAFSSLKGFRRVRSPLNLTLPLSPGPLEELPKIIPRVPVDVLPCSVSICQSGRPEVSPVPAKFGRCGSFIDSKNVSELSSLFARSRMPPDRPAPVLDGLSEDSSIIAAMGCSRSQSSELKKPG